MWADVIAAARRACAIAVLIAGCSGAALAAPSFSSAATADGIRLNVVEAGNRDGPAVLFVHGYSQSYLSWRGQLADPALGAAFHLIAFDLRGHGSSGKPDGPAWYASTAWANDLAAVITHTGARRPVIVAWSMGALVALEYLRAHGSDGVAGLVLVAPAVPADAAGSAGSSVERQAELRLQALAGLRSDDIAANVAAADVFVDMLTLRRLSGHELSAERAATLLTPAYVRRAIAASAVPDLRPLVERLQIPVLIIHGQEDGVVPVERSQALVRRIRTATLSIYESVGHSPFVEAMERFDEDVRRFRRAHQ